MNRGGVTFDSRMRLSASSLTLATRCTLESNGKTSAVASVTAAARISDVSIAVLESGSDEKDDGSVRCSVTLKARELRRCAQDVGKGFEHDCFTLEGTQFVEHGETSFDVLELTKLSD